MKKNKQVLLDAGVFIGALLKGDSRHNEARVIVEKARTGELLTCTTTSISPHKKCGGNRILIIIN